VMSSLSKWRQSCYNSQQWGEAYKIPRLMGSHGVPYGVDLDCMLLFSWCGKEININEI